VDKGISEEIYRRLFDVFLSLKKNFHMHHQSANTEGMTRLRLGALGIMSQMGALPTSDLARLLRISKPQATTLVDGLVASGHATRNESAKDRRIVEIRITEEGLSVLGKALSHVHTVLETRLERLSGEELEALRTSLSVLAPLLEKLQE
jgi:DNA-binding MarR family transcriptional regulator